MKVEAPFYAVEIKNLSKRYRGLEKPVLDGISLEVDQGQIFSLIGNNGEGKSTLIKILLGVVRPTSGNACIFGNSVENYEARKSVGYLPERINEVLPGFLTCRQFLYYYGRLNGIMPRELKCKTSNMLKLIGLKEKEHKKVFTLSKGQQQRLGIAHALLGDPDILFLDEPGDGLDIVGRKELRSLLLELREKGKTLFINSHILSEIQLISDNIAILKGGKILKQGHLKELLNTNGVYEIRIDDGVDHICKELRISLMYDNERRIITVDNVAQLNELIDKLRNWRVRIKEVVVVKKSLEDFVIETLGENGQ